MKKVAWKKVSQYEGPKESPGFLLWQVSTEWRRGIEVALAKFGLTHPQFVLLASLGWLTKNQDNVSQVELAKHCRTDITMTSQVLRTLERKGYIERLQKKDDQRAKFSSLTECGAILVEQAVQAVEEVDENFFKKLGKSQTKLIQLLGKLAYDDS